MVVQMKIDVNGTVPIFQQIVEGVRGEIAAGIYRSGDLIPSVRAQAVASLVNPNTVQRAYEQLERDGLVVSKKGTGMIVAGNGKSIAQEGALRAAKAAFAQGAWLGREAGIARTALDKAYREACGEVFSQEKVRGEA